MTVLGTLAAVTVGWVMWTLTEYVVHRFSFHRRSPGPPAGLIAAEHTRHHRDPAHTNLILRLLGHVAVTIAGAPVGITLIVLTTPAIGIGAWAGWAGGYIIYEVGHWRIHHRAPRTQRGLRQRRHHLIHHSISAATNFGVTVSWWDHTFDSNSSSGPVEVSDRVAPEWLRRNPSAYAGVSLTTTPDDPRKDL